MSFVSHTKLLFFVGIEFCLFDTFPFDFVPFCCYLLNRILNRIIIFIYSFYLFSIMFAYSAQHMQISRVQSPLTCVAPFSESENLLQSNACTPYLYVAKLFVLINGIKLLVCLLIFFLFVICLLSQWNDSVDRVDAFWLLLYWCVGAAIAAAIGV